MFWLQKITVFAVLLGITSCTGCCAFRSCATGGCGLESYYAGGCTDGGCDGCGDGPVIPCRPGSQIRGCGLGLGCIGKLLGMAQSGCHGCGETYYHDWINDPPCCDPCDGNGNYTGGPSGSCGGCDCGGPGCAGIGCDSGLSTNCGCAVSGMEPGCGLSVGIPEPSCGLASECDSCGPYGRTGFQIPGRAIYATWTGVGGLFQEIRRGFLPSCRTCNAFSIADNCNMCSQGCAANAGPTYPTGHASGGCTGCSQNVSIGHTGHQPHVTQHAGRLPHQVVSKQVQVAHGRPPHKLVTDRLVR